MTAATEQLIIAELKVIRRTLDEIRQEGKPGFTQSEFARRLGVSLKTVQRMVKARRIRLQDGRVPHRYLTERLS